MAGGGGGAWKVAYADFVTAMMALFLVLWLVSQDSKVKDAVARTFRNPFSATEKRSTGIFNTSKENDKTYSKGNFEANAPIELGILRRISQDMLKTLASNPDSLEDQPLRMELLSDGIRLTMFDRHQKPLFDPGSPELSEYGRFIFTTMAWQITRFTNNFTLEIEGHTEVDYKPKPGEADAWDLSTERAHATRKLLMEHSVRSSQFRRVSGYADTAPIEGVPVTDERNRRVTLILRANDDVYKF
jgi:chemotaxis protein MotB